MYYNHILNFSYNNNNYELYVDDKGSYFFLGIDKNNNEKYITLEEYTTFAKIFSSRKDILFTQEDNEKQNNEITPLKGKKKGHRYIVPKVIIGGIAVTLTISTLIHFNLLDYQIFNKNNNNISSQTINPNIPTPSSSQRKVISSNGISYDETNGHYYSADGEDLGIFGYIYADNYDPNENKYLDESNIQTSLSFIPQDKGYQTQDDYYRNDSLNLIYISENEYLNQVMNVKTITKQDILNVIKNNKNISSKFKKLINEYVEDLYTTYPNHNYYILYLNLKNIKVLELNEGELIAKTMSHDSLAAYNNAENEIYVLKDYDYANNKWDKQVLYHELSHALRNKWLNDKNYSIKIQPDGIYGNQMSISEALNSVFAVSIYDKTERDIAYQLQSNYILVLLQVLENYKIDDYIDHSITYFANKIDEAHHNNNYAIDILTLMDLQYKDYHSEYIKISQNEYYPIYDLLSDLYFKKYITKDFTYDEAKMVCDKLVDIITYDVPEEYNIDTNRFYENLDNFTQILGIENNQNKR